MLKKNTMKKSIILSVTCLLLAATAFSQSTRGLQRRNKPAVRTSTTTVKTDKQVKRDVNKGGHLNNGDNGDKHNSRGRGDKNNH